MKGGVILFRGSGTDARRYLESDRSRADEYYLESGVALAEFSVVDAQGRVIGAVGLTPEEYAQWVDWVNPLTGESMGTRRLPGAGRQGSPRFAEMVVNAPKSLSIAAALHPEVSEVLDAAQKDAVAEIRAWLGQHSVTRVGPRGKQEVVPIEQLETVAVSHRTSRVGDPHRHIHFQIGTRVWAAGAWRGLDTAALFRQQGAIRALGTAVIAAHPQLAAVLDAHGLTLDPVTGEVAELQSYNAVMSKRGEQVARNLARFEAEWESTHPGQEAGPVVRSRLIARAWDHDRPSKKPTRLGSEAGWLRELEDAGYTPNPTRAWVRPPVALDDLSVQQIASRALDRCAAGASTWTVHTIQEHITRIITETGVRATPTELRDLVALTTGLATEDCLSVLPPDAARPEHVAHLTSLHVAAVETRLRDLLTARATSSDRVSPFVADGRGLDPEQVQAAAAIASTNPLVVVEGAAGAGKTTMLGAAIETAAADGRATRIVTPTKKAADVAAQELGIPAESVAKLVHEHGWRWNRDGAWSRLAPGDTDPETGIAHVGPSTEARLTRGDRIVVDEAGMLDQDTALALLAVADEHGATLALVGDRAQLAGVGRGGVLDMAVQLSARVVGLTTVHRFTEPEYAELTVRMRAGENSALLFDRLHALGLVTLHNSNEDAQDAIARTARVGDVITVATNDEARELNVRIRDERVRACLVDDARTATGNDGLSFGRGDVIQTRHNDADVQVANRQTWTVQDVGIDGAVWAVENGTGRKHQRTVRLPAEYVAEHTHLAYASTAYGVQGTTVSESHTVLGDALDASGVYVGMTRGREANRLHIIAADLDDAREQFTAALERDRADRGLVAATQAARDAVTGLVADGPVKLVNAERARLAAQIDRADRQAAHWKHAGMMLSEQREEHQAEADEQQAVLAVAEAQAERMRSEVVAPLMVQASEDGTAYLVARQRMWDASGAQRSVRRIRKREAARALNTAVDEHRTIETAARRRWGRLPETTAGIESWAASVTQQEASSDVRVAEAREHADEVRQTQQRLNNRQMRARDALLRQVFGDRGSNNPREQAVRWRERAEAARRDLATIEALPPAEAAQLVRARAEQEQTKREVMERALAERQTRAAQPQELPRRPFDHRSKSPDHGFGR